LQLQYFWPVNIFNYKTFGKRPSGKDLARIKQSPYYKKRGFVFMGTKPNANIASELMKAYAKSSKEARSPKIEIPVTHHLKKDFDELPNKKLKVMWLGHAGLLIELAGKRILVDPVLGNRPSPTQAFGPAKRFHAAPISVKELPNIDYIIISHNHYDHLDYDFINAIKHRNITYLLPLGLGATLKYWGIKTKNIYEVNWHEQLQLDGLTFTAADAKHYSGRFLNDRNASFWNSWIIEGNNEKMFISGDSGFIDAYKNIGEQYGPFDLAALAIGAYHRLWPENHKTPEEAWQAFKDLQAKKMLPVHWGTFDLALHPWAEPIERLIEAAGAQKDKVYTPKIGEWLDLEREIKYNEWWK